MLLEKIKNFEWYNEPQDVNFIEEGLLIETQPETDFWQSVDYHFFKDNGHFFFCRYDGDFTLSGKWHFSVVKDSAQCGIMVRCDQQNWVKTGLLSPQPTRPQVGVIVANQGSSDWSLVEIPEGTNQSKGYPIDALVSMSADEQAQVIYSIYRDTNA